MYFCVLHVCTSFRGQKGALDFPGTVFQMVLGLKLKPSGRTVSALDLQASSVPDSHLLKTLTPIFLASVAQWLLTSPEHGYVFVIVVFFDMGF